MAFLDTFEDYPQSLAPRAHRSLQVLMVNMYPQGAVSPKWDNSATGEQHVALFIPFSGI